MSNDKPYTINVEVPTDSIAREETREVSDILLSGLSDLFNRISLSLRGTRGAHSNTDHQFEVIDDVVDADYIENNPCDKDKSVIYQDIDKDNN